MTTEEMARMIGVSRITLSKVINGKTETVAPDTVEYIKKCLEQYCFVPNSQARAMVGKREPIIGFFTTYADNMADDEHVSTTFATEMINHCVTEANIRGYKTLLCISGKKDDFGEVARYISSGLVTGAILLGYVSGTEDLALLKGKVPVVLINQEEAVKYSNISLANMADEEWAFYAMEQLIQHNHKHLMYITCSRNRLPITRRNQGVKRALMKYQDKVLSYKEFKGEYSEDITYDIIKKVYSEDRPDKPTGIFAANDQMAIGAIKALKSMNIKVPEEVSVIGFDDIPIARYLSPALATVHCDMRTFAKKSVDMLIDSIEKKTEATLYEQHLAFIKRDSLDYCHES